MPNTGHRWTEAEDRAARVSWPHYDVFCLIVGHDTITYHAWRHRLRYLSRLPVLPTHWERIKSRVKGWLS